MDKDKEKVPNLDTRPDEEQDNWFLRFQTIPEALAALHEESGKTAILCGNESISYRELIIRAKRLAWMLHGEGIGRGDRVLISMERTISAAVGILGVLFAGAAYVPADRRWPRERLEFVRRDSGVRTVLDQEKLDALLKKEDHEGGGPLPFLHGEDEFAVYYTSGSTGRPKGCVTHHQVHYHLDIPHERNLQAGEISRRCERVFSMSGLSFIGSADDLFMTLLCGKTLVLATEEERMNAALIGERLLDTGADVLHTTPSVMSSLLSEARFCPAMKSLRLIILGGEPLSEKLIERISGLCDAHILNVYGATETNLFVGTRVFVHETPRLKDPVYGARLLLLDDSGHEVSVGKEGEVCAGGIPARLGYYVGNPALTSRKYIKVDGLGRVYRTGDRGIRMEDGSIRLTGREDNLKKFHGQRIEIEEIEGCLESFPGIERAAADLRGEEPDTLLCAWYTASRPLEEGALRAYLTKKLPSYMIPNRMREVREMPLSPNGKLLRHLLPDLSAPASGTVGADASKTPLNEWERAICQAFSEVLKADDIGRDSNFFRLGGDSLLAMRLLPLLQRKTGVHYSFEDLVRNPAPESLAKVPGRRESAPETEKTRAGRVPSPEAGWEEPGYVFPPEMEALAGQAEVEAVYPADYATVWMLVVEKLSPMMETGLYTHARAQLNRTLSETDIKARVEKLLLRHPVLRSFPVADQKGHFWQVFYKRAKVPVWYRDLRELDRETRERFVSGFLYVMREDGAPFQVACFPAGEGGCTLLVRVKHTLADGISVRILINELAGDDMDAGTDRFYEFRTRQLARGADFPEEWRGYYQRLEGHSFAPPAVRPFGTDDFEALEKSVKLTKEQTEALITGCSQKSTTLSIYVTWCYGRALLQTRKMPEAWFFCSVSGRDPDFEGSGELVGNLARNMAVFIREDMTEEEFYAGLMLPWKFPYGLEAEEYRRLKPYNLEYGIIARFFPALHENIAFYTDDQDGRGSGNYMRLADGCLEVVLRADRGQKGQAQPDAMAEVLTALLSEEPGPGILQPLHGSES